MASYENLSVDHDDGVATVTLASTAGRNALTLEMANELVSVATTLGDDPETRCIVLTHEGTFFGSGADLSQLSGDGSDAPHLRELAGRAHEAITQFHRAKTPVVGGINGVAAGIGFSLALMPDLVVLGEDATLKFAYPGIGLTGDGGATFFLPRLVGLRTAKEIVLRDEAIAPDEAVEMGLATEVAPADEFDERLEAIASELAAGPTHALGTATQLLTDSYERGLEGQLAVEADAIADASKTEDYEIGLEAFFGDGDPEFVGR
ncbi:enoyl-CoA hydratase/isomerase family protein [Natronorubrum bangense]|uniref:Enoyl-CoA hydratase/isomerase n=2 Tax=Natronorubrum bangense TaxID=61858 RepID=L9W5M2_9EURY|nr:enoyl-CoA hydratase/isomerase family protein [Natronorubrum bangense]ELY44769.1 Enoyl-CoA hydratase/isomerase [Natronorubrum bangense JCM 10635]QCC56780.1 enoyl-CoA hydratase/isomerase family protein [Natronorubrum bangense]